MKEEDKLKMELTLPVTFFQDMRAKIRASDTEINGVKVSVIGVDETFCSLVMETVIENAPNMIEVDGVAFLYQAHAHFQDPKDDTEQLPVLIYRKFV